MPDGAGPATVAEALNSARQAGLDRLDAQLLLVHALGHDRAWLLAHDDHRLNSAQLAAWRAKVARRANGEPLAYLTSEKEFFGLTLKVDSAVLVPRPDTETLVEWALERLQQRGPDQSPPRVLDLGTGSGAIALALKHAHPAAQVVAVDASPEALAIAVANGNRLQLAVDWRRGDWWSPVQAETFALVASNPPYIREGDPHLVALRHEPIEALTSGPDGLADLRRIIAGAAEHLEPDGWLLLEHGHDQSQAVQSLMAASGYTDLATRQDLAGRPRCTGGRRPTAHP